jgi:predicted permease
MNPLVVSALLPVIILVAIGLIAARAGLVGAAGIKDLSNLVFMVLTPALLFRTMNTVHIERLDFAPIAAYFAAAFLVFFGVLVLRGFSRESAVLALAATFSNTVMIGIPLVGLAYGEPGVVILLTLISVHALVLLTSATIVLELAVAREAAQGNATGRPGALRTVALAARNAIIHPVPLPIIAGLLFAASGWALPAEVDKVLGWLGAAFGPLALLLVGMTLAGGSVRAHWKAALVLALAKNAVMPLMVAGFCTLLGVQGLPMLVMVVAASMPIGANVFMFSQRYAVGEDVVTAAVGLSSLLSLLSLSVVMAWVGPG